MEKKKRSYYIKLVLWVFLCFLAMVTLRLVSWIFNNWANLRTDELIYTLTSSLTGTNPLMVRQGLTYVLVPSVIVCIILILTFHFLKRDKNRSVFVKASSALAAIVFLASIGVFVHKVGIIEYFMYKNEDSDFIENNYVNPAYTTIEFPENRRNLIYIFVESMESSYSDLSNGGGKTENIIPELTQIGLENEMFSGDENILNGGVALPGTTYTMGGLFAQTSGLPLIISNDILSQRDGFLPEITALGDILETEGYHNVFFLGTDASFGQRDLYFQSHGNYEIIDFNSAIEANMIPADYQRDWWGYDDYLLYENAKTELLELAAAGEPFNFTMLTVDTHAENGYICEQCDNSFPEQYANALHCADHQVASFVAWIQEQDFYENTTIVIAGDHCTMDSDFCSDISSDYSRKVYSVFINSAVESESNDYREYSTIDLFPTTIAALGATIDGNRLGLGTNLFSNEETLIETYGVDYLTIEFSKNSLFFESFLGAELELGIQLSLDESTDSIIVKLKSTAHINGEFDYIYCDVTHVFENFTEQVRYTLELDGDYYTCTVPLEDYFYSLGNYNFRLFLMLPDGLPRYYGADDLEIKSINTSSDISAVLTDDGEDLIITYNNSELYNTYWFPVWSAAEGQDDIVWYGPFHPEDGEMVTVTIPLEDHLDSGELVVQFYVGNDDALDQMMHQWSFNI